MATSRGNLEFGALPEPGGPSHFHIMRAPGQDGSGGMDLFFGDDYNYVRQRPAQYGDSAAFGVEIGTNESTTGTQYVWRFETDGILTTPGSIIPNTNIAYDLGSPTQQWRHIYVNTGSIYLGGIKLSTENNQLVVQEVTNIGGDEQVVTNYALQNADRLVSGNVSAVLSNTGTLTFNTETRITIPGTPAFTATIAWYNIFGELNNANSGEWTGDGSVAYDSEGNVYMLGSTTDSNNGFDGTNLFLKYSPQGQLLWRKTWTDESGMNCGSYNASMRFLPMSGTATIDTIVWASNSNIGVGYIGTMDLDGNLVDLNDQARAPLAISDYRITDIVPVGDLAYISGSWFDQGSNLYQPSIAGVDFNDPNNYENWIFDPADRQPGANTDFYFKSINGALGAVWATGAYDSSLWNGGTHKPILAYLDFTGPQAYIVNIGNNYDGHDMWIEDSGSDTDGNAYAIVNVNGYDYNTETDDSNYMVVISSDLEGLIGARVISRWQKKILRPGQARSINGLGLDYRDGYIYVSFNTYGIDGVADLGVLKLDAATGAVVWARKIGSPSNDGTWDSNNAGYGSSSDITIDPTGTYLSFTAVTLDQSTGTQYINNFTIQYPLDGSLLGTFNDFEITDFIADIEVTDHDFTVADITNDTSINILPLSVSTATLIATATTVGTGWTNFRWPLEDEGPAGTSDQTWTFGQDGKLQLPGALGFTHGYIDQAAYGQPLIVSAGADLQIKTAENGNTWEFGVDGELRLAGDIIASNGHFVQDCFNDTTSFRWVNSDGTRGDQELGRVYRDGGNPYTGGDEENERVQFGYVDIDTDVSAFYIETTKNPLGLFVEDTDDSRWEFQGTGGLQFPDGTVQTTAWINAVAVSETAPADSTGRLWFNSTDSRLYVKYNNQWVDANPAVVPPASTYTGELEISETRISNTDYTGTKDIEIENSDKVWKFASDGELTVAGNIKFPDNTVQTTAWTNTAPLEIDGGDAGSWA